MPGGGSSPVAARTSRKARLTERHVLALGLGVSGIFVLAAGVVAAATLLGGGNAWAAVHLALAGAAGTAIGAFMPHFAVTLAGTRPEPALQRLLGLALLAGGAALAVAGVTLLGGLAALLGSVTFVAGLGVTAWQTAVPSRSPLSRRHPIVTATYLVALAEMATGVILGGLAAAGFAPVTDGWLTLRGAHAWLTLFGAVSLTIFGTLIYLAPTILGARIRPGRALVAGTVGMLGGPIVAVVGFMVASRELVAVGAAATLVGGIGQIGYVVDVIRRRGPFTSEHDWRRMAYWPLLAGTGWFAAATAVGLGELTVGGRGLFGWSIGPLAVPLIGGWMAQALVGSWTHLVPMVTPGTPQVHAAQRRALAPGSRVRPLAWNAGVGLAWTGAAAGIWPVTVTGAVLIGAPVLVSVVLLGRALATSRG
jgi:hypothetical protein